MLYFRSPSKLVIQVASKGREVILVFTITSDRSNSFSMDVVIDGSVESTIELPLEMAQRLFQGQGKVKWNV